MKNRRSDLDWLRVTAFGLLILYHSGMAWSGWHWHLNSTQDIAWLREAMRFVNRRAGLAENIQRVCERQRTFVFELGG